jgi:hypothetical protein
MRCQPYVIRWPLSGSPRTPGFGVRGVIGCPMALRRLPLAGVLSNGRVLPLLGWFGGANHGNIFLGILLEHLFHFAEESSRCRFVVDVGTARQFF